jgi:hypothetical protein
MTRLKRERSYKRFSKGEIGERAAAAADLRNLITKASMPGSPPKWRMIIERVLKLAQDHDVLAKMVHGTLHSDQAALKKSAR